MALCVHIATDESCSSENVQFQSATLRLSVHPPGSPLILKVLSLFLSTLIEDHHSIGGPSTLWCAEQLSDIGEGMIGNMLDNFIQEVGFILRCPPYFIQYRAALYHLSFQRHTKTKCPNTRPNTFWGTTMSLYPPKSKLGL